ncbi:MAG: phosphatidate cytidylyltransferase [Anaerolineales bacterium]|nr:phosphatidate cytidylyltransferase [Anaerolineales bacterium]
MLIDRLAMSIVLVPAAVWVLALGGPAYTILILLTLSLAAREYVRFFRAGGGRPAEFLILAGVLALGANRYWHWVDQGFVLSAFIVAGLIWHLMDYERGAHASGTDFVATLGGVLYIGWMGSYLIALRHFGEDGLWWSAVALGTTWLADTGAYFSGRAFGRTPMAPRLSPKKTWEGFIGGVLWASISGGLLGGLWTLAAAPGSQIGIVTGLGLGALAGLAGPTGDLGISMLKRQTGLKDAGDLLAGHGGVLDRIDSWLVAVPVCFYAIILIEWFARG